MHLSRSVVPLARRWLKLLLTNFVFLLHRPSPALKQPIRERNSTPFDTIVFDVEGWLLRSSATFPYFMLVALEAGGLFRALLLLLTYPILFFLRSEAAVRLMVMVCFFGARKERLIRVGRTVLSKLFMEDVGEEGFEAVRQGRRRAVGVSKMPRVMVESFLKEYLDVDAVIGTEMNEFCGFYTGFMKEEGEENVMMLINGGEALGFGCYAPDLHHKIFSCCKEVYRVTEAEKSRWRSLPREKYPKPLVFHDGRLAFRPTPTATLAMFMWLPLGIVLSLYRTIIFILLPQYISIPLCAFTGTVTRLINPIDQTQVSQTVKLRSKPTCNGRLYICNHRTLLDPIYISASLNKQVIAVIYSLSPVSEFLSPIRTARLTRNKEEDRKKMEELLKQGDLVVCPEGTTCREPYLLRFSPLFAELVDEVTPVALKAEVTMFYGTTAGGFKWLDSFYFLMNPRPKYVVQFLGRIPTAADNMISSPCKMADLVQSEIGQCLGFKCTTLTRKDKYQVLVGTDGNVRELGGLFQGMRSLHLNKTGM